MLEISRFYGIIIKLYFVDQIHLTFMLTMVNKWQSMAFRL